LKGGEKEMAVVKGGLHGRPRGAVAGIVYGAARSRQGKVVTAREYVVPGPTEDADVLAQRSVFASILYAVRYLAAACWQVDFNRAIGQLPGFHSIMSILLGSCPYSDKLLVPPADTPLGNLYTPVFSPVPHGSVAGSITITWTTGLGINGTDLDRLVVILVEKEQTAGNIRGANYKGEVADRTDGTVDIATGASGTDWVVGCYFRGAGTAEGLLGPVKWYAVKSNPP
jgi:hypothetical protein